MTMLRPSANRLAAPSLRPVLLTCLIAAGIAWGTLTPSGGGPTALPLGDKQLHALGFALLIFPLAWANLRRALWVAPLCLAFGAAIEIVQPMVGRSGELADLAADALGIGLGLTSGWALTRAKSRALRKQ